MQWTFSRLSLLIPCCILLLASVAPRLGPAPRPADPRPPARIASTSAPPAQQAYSLPPGKLAQAVALSRIDLALEIIGSLWSLAFLWILLAMRWAAGLAAWTERLLRRRWMQGLLFFAAFLAITTVAGLPLDAIGHIVSRHYGISVQSWASWLGDLARGLGLTLLFGPPILLFFNWIVRVSPRRYWLWAWLVSLPLILLTTFAAPLFDPIFNQFEPLLQSQPALVARLEAVVARTGTRIAPGRIFLMKASAKSNGLNAYVTGIGATKRFVLWDTAIDGLPGDEILFIFGHESGHYVLNHIPKELAGSAIGLFFVAWACAGFAAWLVRRFGLRWQLYSLDESTALSTSVILSEANRDSQRQVFVAGVGERSRRTFVSFFAKNGNQITPLASRQGFLVLLFALSAAGILLQPAGNAFSRHFEHEADIYGQEAIHDLVADPQKTTVSAFNHIGEAWLEDPNPSPFVEFWQYSHPSVQHRAEFALHYNPWANGGHGRFFDK